MSDLSQLQKHAKILSKHVWEGHGHKTAGDLDNETDAYDRMSEDARDDGDIDRTEKYDRKAGHREDMARDVRSAHAALKAYGAGHNMKHHGEGKPYGDKS